MQTVLLSYSEDEVHVEDAAEFMRRAFGRAPVVFDHSSAGLDSAGAYRLRRFAAVEGCDSSRNSAVRLLAHVGQTRLAVSGRPLRELAVGDGPSFWWTTEISVQEHVFRLVWFLDRLDCIFRELNPRAYGVLGSDTGRPWEADLAHRFFESRGVKRIELEAPAATRPVPGTVKWSGIARLSNGARLVRECRRFVSWRCRIQSFMANLGRRFVFGIGHLMTHPRMHRVTRAVFKLAAKSRFIGLRRWVATSILGAPGLMPTGASLGPREWARAQVRAGVKAVRTQKIHRLQHDGRPVVCVVEEYEAVRKRYDPTRRRPSSYNPYTEGVARELGLLGNVSVIRLLTGTSGAVTAQSQLDGVAAQVWRFLARNHVRKDPAVFLLEDFLEDEREDSNEANSAEAFDRITEGTLADPGLRAACRYLEVDLYALLEPRLKEAAQAYLGRRKNADAYRRFLELVRPAATVMTNFEGVFRNFVDVQCRFGIPLVGLQQALGPYQHGLDHRPAGVSTPDSVQFGGCPAPNHIAVWGEGHLNRLVEYGATPGKVSVVGYPRLDEFVRSRGRVNRNRVLRSIGIKDPATRLVLYTGLLRAAGMTIMPNRKYVDLFRRLRDEVMRRPGVYLAVKPWGGDNLPFVLDLVQREGHGRVLYLDPRTDLHNTDLLSVSDVVVGSFSSFFAEAVVSGVPSIFVSGPDGRAYFETADESWLAASTLYSDSHEQVLSWLVRCLDDPDFTAETIANSRQRLRPWFGRLDGMAAYRLARVVEADAICFYLGLDRSNGPLPTLIPERVQ